MAKTLDKPSLYETGYVAWLEDQAARQGAGRLAALDAPNVAEELEGLMKSQRQQLEKRLEVLHPEAVEQAAIKTGSGGTAFPATLPYALEGILTHALPAGEPPAQRST